MINSIGLPNKGLAGFLAEDLPRLAELPVPLIVSVVATGRGEFAKLVEAVGARGEVAAIELNVSCPNVESGLIVGEQPAETEALPASGEPALAAGHGGLSGPAVRPIALQQLRAVTAVAGIPAIGMGGISSGADAREFLAAGASLVAVGTENFRHPRAGSRVAKELDSKERLDTRALPVLDLE